MVPSNKLEPYRCAVYFAPAINSPWGESGRRWLGRCAMTNERFTQPIVEGASADDVAEILAEPVRYGWHATLKAPFRLSEGVLVSDLQAALRSLAADLRSVDLPALTVCQLGSFLALKPICEAPRVQALAAECVTRLHHFAMPLDAAELARRRRANLTLEEEELLKRWGYPWVLNRFRFHFSLTGSLAGVSAAVKQALAAAASAHFEALPTCALDRLALFVEPTRGAHFVCIDQVKLKAPTVRRP